MEFADRSKQRKKELYEKKTLSFQEWMRRRPGECWPSLP